MKKGLLLILLPLMTLSAEDFFLIDDFSREISAMGKPWKGFTDQVMGGISEIFVSRIKEDDIHYLRMSGQVSLENNGGFIQVRHLLTDSLSMFDASSFRGIRLVVRGRGRGYYIFIRTSDTILPWKFYKARINLSEDWLIVDIP